MPCLIESPDIVICMYCIVNCINFVVVLVVKKIVNDAVNVFAASFSNQC